MAITVQVPSVLRASCGGAAELEVDAGSVREALEQIEREYPALYVNVCNELGAVRPHVNLFVNSSLVTNKSGLNQELKPGDVLFIFQAVSGG